MVRNVAERWERRECWPSISSFASIGQKLFSPNAARNI
jgi:hypothetical protein